MEPRGSEAAIGLLWQTAQGGENGTSSHRPFKLWGQRLLGSELNLEKKRRCPCHNSFAAPAMTTKYIGLLF